MSTTATQLGDFVHSDDESKHTTDGWPLSVNGHRVIQIAPRQSPVGADGDTAFHCLECDETFHPPPSRIADREWADNRFENTAACAE